MPTEPLEPLTPPAFLASATAEGIVSLAFLVLFVVWSIYTLISAYHWLRYGHRSAVAIPALLIHVVVSWLLAGYAASGLIG